MVIITINCIDVFIAAIKLGCSICLLVFYGTYTESTKSDQKGYFFTVTLKVVTKFPSNLTHNVKDKILITPHKNYPLHLMCVCTYTTL